MKKILIILFLLSGMTQAQFKINYQKNSGQKSNWSLEQNSYGVKINANKQGKYRMIIGNDPAIYQQNRKPAGNDQKYQRYLRGSSHNELYDNKDNYELLYPIQNKVYR